MVRFTWIFSLLAVFCGGFWFGTPVTSAQTEAAGVSIRPAVVEDAVEPGETKQYNFTVANLSDSEKTYYLFVRDIIGVDDNNAPIFAKEGRARTGAEVSEWTTLSVRELTLAPDESQPVTAVVELPDTASPGSHFGGVFVSAEPPKLDTIGASVGYQVANIMTLQVAGDAQVNAFLRSLATDAYVYDETDVTFTAEVENRGNVLIRPVGPLEVTNMFGEEVTSIRFNDEQVGVFPQDSHTLSARWEEDGFHFGRYTAVLSLVYGDADQQSTMSSTVTFWMLPGDILWPALGVLAVLLLIGYVAVRLYVRSAVEHAVGKQRVVRRKRKGRGVSVLLITLIVLLSITALFLIILLALFA